MEVNCAKDYDHGPIRDGPGEDFNADTPEGWQAATEAMAADILKAWKQNGEAAGMVSGQHRKNRNRKNLSIYRR